MKTLLESINEIKNANTSRAAKRAALVSLGLMPYEVTNLMKSFVTTTDSPARSRVNFTFGVEIECGVHRTALQSAAANTGLNYRYEGYNHNDNIQHFKFVPDGSVRHYDEHNHNIGIECVSPVLKGASGRKALKACCDTLNAAGAVVNKTCGLHVHIGAADLTEQAYANVFYNYAQLELLIDSFMAPSRRRNANGYCKSINDKAARLATCTTREDVQRVLRFDRYHKVNPQSWHAHKTIEFRHHQGSTCFEKIDMWVRFCGKLVEWSKTNRLTSEVYTLDEMPFLTADEKRYIKARQEFFATQMANVA